MQRITILSAILVTGLLACDRGTDPDTEITLRSSDDNEAIAHATAVVMNQTFKQPADAEAAGYAPVSPCLEGLGIHYVDFANFADDVIALNKPETLRYAPNEDGEIKLVAVEYSILSIYPKPEPLLGQEWVGPASTGIEGVPPIWFTTISVRHNDDGIFSTYNPAVACRGTGVALALEPCADDPAVLCLTPSTCEDLGLDACIEWEQSQG